MATYATHRKARFDYTILETFEAGIELFGHEAKSVRHSQVTLEGGYVIIRGGEAYLTNVSIRPYQQKNTPTDYDPMRPRRLLLSKKQIAELLTATDTRGLTIVPLSMYNNNRVVKVEIALAKGKKKGDKRETIKRRDSDREIRREMKG